MTVEQLIKELQSLKKELHSKEVFSYQRNGELSKIQVKTILKNAYNPLDQSDENVIGIFIGS